jgi:lysyl-tRNA synthetase class 2
MPGLFLIESDYGSRIWYNQADPLIQALNKFERNFGNDEFVGYVLYDKDGIFTEKQLLQLRELTQNAWKIQDVVRADSLANSLVTEVSGDDFKVTKLLPDEKIDNLFSLSYCFRDEPDSPIHRHQFLMLEWYRKNERYEKIMQDVEVLIQYCLNSNLPIRSELKGEKLVKKTMQQLFKEILDIDILNYLDIPSIKLLLKDFPDVPVPASDCEWDDYFFLLYLNKIEPKIAHYPLLLIDEFPAPLSALSTLKESDKRVCERFEVYIRGVELCNCFNELTDPIEQKKRFDEQNILKKKLYGYDLPGPTQFYQSLERGLPPSAGIALGVERLLSSLCDIENPFFY